MIKINLLPQGSRKAKRRQGPAAQGSGLLAIFMLALVLEVGGLLWWQGQAEEAAAQIGSGFEELRSEKERLERVLKEGKDLQELRDAVQAQRVVFEVLENGKIGPLHMLLFVSYALQRVDATLPEDEYRVLSRVWTPEQLRAVREIGADTEWDPDTVWLTEFRESNGEVTIKGEAKDHEDVMTFMRRLRTGIYFELVDLKEQARKSESAITANAPEYQTPYVQFTLTAELNYDPTGYPPL